MATTTRSAARTILVAVRSMVLITLVLGLAYPFAMTGFAQLALPWQANGSMLTDASGEPVGSALIGQNFTDADGKPLREYFQSRPSAAGDEGYDGGASSGSNLGPENPELIDAIRERKAQIAAFNGVPESAIPAEAVTASGSGLDPHISPAYAELQVARVAEERGLVPATVRRLVAEATSPRDLTYIGEPVVNVLRLNLALDELKE